MKRILKISIISSSILLLVIFGFTRLGLTTNEDFTAKLQNGDIIFQISASNQSKAIQIATRSRYSHMGIIYKKGDKIQVLEAVQPVKLTPLDKWIERGKHKHFVVKRLKNAEQILTPTVLKEMEKIGQSFIGKKYDLAFNWSDEKIYCSELVWKIYKRAANTEIGKLETLKDFDLSHQVVKQKISERYGKNIPMNEPVISPATMFNSPKLITVYTSNE